MQLILRMIIQYHVLKFVEVVEWVEPENEIQLITNNDVNYKKAWELLHEICDNIYWLTPNRIDSIGLNNNKKQELFKII